MTPFQIFLGLALSLVVFLVVVAIFDVTQKKHAIKRNFPILGNFRYLLELIGPELRQYIVTGNDEERPFSRDQRRWVYASSKKENNYFGFGTDADLELAPNFLIIKQSAFPLQDLHPGMAGYDSKYSIPCAKIFGGHRNRGKAFRPKSVVNVSAMSYGSLSATAVEALNRGCVMCDSMHNTGEGGISVHHDHGANILWQIGTGYFGCRDEHGKFSMARFKETLSKYPVAAIEIKISQGAKPGLGGLLPAAKVTREIAEIRGIPIGKDCISPAAHSTFSNVDSMLDFVESLATESGLPVGIKSAVGQGQFWVDLAQCMSRDSRGVDFVTVDGGEGGTGAAPLSFTDHVSLPFKVGFVRVFREFLSRGIDKQVVFIGSGKLGFPDTALLAFCLGCDMINVAREAMLAIGCIQAQKCHTGHCPTGVATQSKWLMGGLDPTLKAARLANYVTTLRKELLSLSRACGVEHPALITPEHCEILDDRFTSKSVRDIFDLDASLGWGITNNGRRQEIASLMNGSGKSPAQSTH